MLSVRDMSPSRSRSPSASGDNLFVPDSDYVDRPCQPSAPNIMAQRIDTSGIDKIRQVCSAMENWTSTLGPVEDWPRVFREQYDEACLDTTTKTTQDAIDTFLGQVEEHVKVGKSILAGLEGCAAVKVHQSQLAEADWLLAGDLMRTLHRGVAVLEARLEIHAPSGPHESSLHSNIRRHEEFIT
jgi:hypothetical protein